VKRQDQTLIENGANINIIPLTNANTVTTNASTNSNVFPFYNATTRGIKVNKGHSPLDDLYDNVEDEEVDEEAEEEELSSVGEETPRSSFSHRVHGGNNNMITRSNSNSNNSGISTISQSFSHVKHSHSHNGLIRLAHLRPYKGAFPAKVECQLDLNDDYVLRSPPPP
jgi:hypothetical protein